MTGTMTSSADSGTAAEKVQAAVGTATEKARETGSELTHKASDQVETAAHRMGDKVDERKGELVETARSVQEKAHEFARSMCEEQPAVGKALEQVVHSADRAISYAEQTHVEQMGQELREQMRKRPMLFAAGMFGAGFALTRALKPVDASSATGGARQVGPTSQAQLPRAAAQNGRLD